MMEVIYISNQTHEELQKIETNDVAGILAASKDGEIAFLDGIRKYETHTLCFYIDKNDEVKQYLRIYVN